MKFKYLSIFAVVVILLSGCASKSVKNQNNQADEIQGKWVINSLEIANVYQQLAVSEITFEKKTKNIYSIYGDSGINSFFGEVKVDGDNLFVGNNMGSTKMAGSPELMEFEDNFIACLTTASKIYVETTQGGAILKIINSQNDMCLTFRRGNFEE